MERDEAIMLVKFIAAFFILAFICIMPIYVLDKKACTNYQEITKRQTEYFICGGCFVNDGDVWLKMDEYKSVITARDGLKNR